MLGLRRLPAAQLQSRARAAQSALAGMRLQRSWQSGLPPSESSAGRAGHWPARAILAWIHVKTQAREPGPVDSIGWRPGWWRCWRLDGQVRRLASHDGFLKGSGGALPQKRSNVRS